MTPIVTSLGCLGLNSGPGRRRVGVVGVAGGAQLGAGALLVVVRVQAEHPAQERERRDDLARAARRGLGDEHLRVRQAAGGESALGGEEEVAVDPRRQRRVLRGGVLRQEELRLVGLVPDRPARDPRPEVARGGGDEGLELLRLRPRDVVLRAVRRPPRHRARDRQQDLPAARDRAVDLRVVGAPVVVRRVGRVEVGLDPRRGGRGDVLPQHHDAQRLHAEARDLVEGLRARRRVGEVDGRLERHRLVGGGLRVAGNRGNGDERAEREDEWRDS